MKKVVIASACRTAIGQFGGTLANVPAAELEATVFREALSCAGIGSVSTMTKAEGEAFGKLGNDIFLMIESFPLSAALKLAGKIAQNASIFEAATYGITGNLFKVVPELIKERKATKAAQ